MTQEDKQLLLLDLCTRLPYGVKINTPYNDATLVGIVNRKGYRTDIDYIDIVTDKQTYPIRYIQPYLRPMSSMTEEEKEEFYTFQYKFTLQAHEYQELNKETFSEYLDWLNKNMFDYRGLIPKGLALEAPEEMYNLNREI